MRMRISDFDAFFGVSEKSDAWSFLAKIGPTRRFLEDRWVMELISSKLDGETSLVPDMLVLQSGRHGLRGFS